MALITKNEICLCRGREKKSCHSGFRFQIDITEYITSPCTNSPGLKDMNVCKVNEQQVSLRVKGTF